jgi:hypothetical protein
MDQEFYLKYYGGYSRFESALMTAEERSWVLNKINEEIKKQNDSGGGSKGYGGRSFA